MKTLTSTLLAFICACACVYAEDQFIVVPEGSAAPEFAVAITNFGTGSDQAARGDWHAALSNTVAAREAQFVAGSPTNGAVWLATNTIGGGKWSLPVAFSAYLTNDFILSNAVERTLSFASPSGKILSNFGNAFDGTNFIAPVDGIYDFMWYLTWFRVSGLAVYGNFYIYVNGELIKEQRSEYFDSSARGYLTLPLHDYFLTNGAVVTVTSKGVGGTTNRISSAIGLGSWSGKLIREIP